MKTNKVDLTTAGAKTSEGLAPKPCRTREANSDLQEPAFAAQTPNKSDQIGCPVPQSRGI